MTTGANIHVLLLHNCGFHDLNVLTFRRLLFHIEGGEGRGGEGRGWEGGVEVDTSWSMRISM